MNPSAFPFRDFVRARASLCTAIFENEEHYVLLVGETGTGKTALLRDLKEELDRRRFRTIYFAGCKRLGGPGLVKVIGNALKVRHNMCHAVLLDRVQRAVSEDPQHILVWIDEAQDLMHEACAELQAIVENDLGDTNRVQVLFSGLPITRSVLQEQRPLWRRVVVREEIRGLAEDEVQPFLDHHFQENGKRLCDRGLRALFERAKGAPGLLIAMYRTVLSSAGQGERIDATAADEILERWDLP